jgi:hypothetical protein
MKFSKYKDINEVKKILYQIKLFFFFTFVAVLLLVNKALIRLVPFKKLITLYANTEIHGQLSEMGRVQLIHRAINRFDKILFIKILCFEQSLTAMVLARLFQLPASVYFGIKKSDEGEILAHAWSQIGDVFISGYRIRDEYTVVYKMYYVPKDGRKRCL